jgi:hypothetical protein
MKFGARKPSFKKSLSARTTGKLTRQIKKSLIPGYGKKGRGMITDPKKSLYNKIYNRTSYSKFNPTSKNRNSNSYEVVITILLFSLFFSFYLIYWTTKGLILIIKYCCIGIQKLIEKKHNKI